MKRKLRKLAALLAVCMTLQMLLPSAALAAESTAPAETIEATESSEGTDTAASAEAIESADTIASAEPIETTDTADFAETVMPTETVEAEETALTTEDTAAAETAETVEITEPAETADPAQAGESEEAADVMDAEAAVSSISYKRAIPYIAWLEQDFEYNEATGTYRCNSYNTSRFHGDRLIVNYEDGSEKVYVYSMDEWEYVNEADAGDTLSDSDVIFNMGDYYGNWAPDGDQNYYEVSYGGVSCKVPIEVRSTPVKEIEYLPLPRFLYAKDHSYGSFTGDKVIVTYKDGSTETFVFDRDADADFDPGYHYSQSGWGAFVSEKTGIGVPEYHPYDVYSEMLRSHDYETGEDSISYKGVSDVAEGCTYIATDISFRQASPKSFLEGSGEKRTDASGKEYEYYDINDYNRFEYGDQLVIRYENSLGESRDITYTYNYGDSFEMEDIGDGRDSNNYIYRGYLSLENFDQEQNPLLPGESYSYNIRWDETLNEGDEVRDLVTSDSPYQITIKSRTVADPSKIENPRAGETYSNGFYVIWDDFTPPEGETAKRIRLTGSYQGEEIINTDYYYSPSSESASVMVSMYMLKSELAFEEGSSYPVTYTLEALNGDEQVIAFSDPFTLTLSITGITKTPNEMQLPDSLNAGKYYYISSPSASVEYKWKIEGSETKSWNTSESIGSITGATSSDPSVIDVPYNGEIKALKPGTSTITLSYTQNGTAKTMSKLVTVRDQYLEISFMQEGVLNYYSMPVGTSRKYLMSSVLYKWNETDSSYEFSGVVTGETTFTVENINYIYGVAPGTSHVDYSDKVHLTIEGDELTIAPDPDLPSGELWLEIKGTCGDLTGTGTIDVVINSTSRLLRPDENFLFPLPGDSAELTLNYEVYENGTAIDEEPALIGIKAKGLTIKDKDGNEVTDVCTMSQFPLTLTNTGTESNATIRFEAYNSQEDLDHQRYTCWLYMLESDALFFAKLTVPEPQVYTGQALTPEPTLQYGSRQLPLSDYDIEYYNNINAGTATIRLVEKDDSSRWTAATFTIEKAEQPLKAEPAAISLMPGETAAISVSGTKEESAVTYQSSDESVATVTNSGIVTAKKAGNASITVTAAETANYKQSKVSIDIKVQSSGTPVEKVTLNQSEISIPMLGTYQLKATVTPANADNKNIRWTSSNEAVASVDDNGLVKVKKYGTAVIKAVALDDPSGKISASCTIHTLFGDTMDPKKYYYKPIYWAADQGITQGYSSGQYAGQFGVGLNCTRGELLVFLWRFDGQKTGYGDARTMFNDVTNPTTSAFNKAIAWAYKTGIVKGYADGGIHPNAPIVRKDVMIMLYRLAGKPSVSGTMTFTDCKSFKTTSDTYKAILWGSQNGITNGYSSGQYKGQFGVSLNCLREQIVTFLYRYNSIK